MSAKPSPIEIRFHHSLLGMVVEIRASSDVGWQPIEIVKYGTSLNADKTQAAYLAKLAENGVDHRVIPYDETDMAIVKTQDFIAAKPSCVEIRFHHSQLGMAVEARRAPGEAWSMVQICPYGDSLNTARTERSYLAELDERGIAYRVVPYVEDPKPEDAGILMPTP